MLTAAITILLLTAQQEAHDLARAQEAEGRRVATMARVAPAVCSIMPLNAPGGGSGVVIDPFGFVLTNFHVVGKPDVKTMKVGLPDGNLYLADVLGVDPGSDLAILVLRPREGTPPFPHAELGDSDRLRPGDMVFAMGNPFLLATDFQPTVTFGIVSGVHRYQPGGNQRMLVYPDCIQVDAPVNPGNSGGPLFDAEGKVVGINGRISVRDRGRVNTGVGFAVSSNQIRNFLGDLMAGKHAEHGTLDMNAWFMKSSSGDRLGVFVQSLFKDSVAANAGIGLGDEITSFNGAHIENANHMATLIGVLPAGSEVSVGYRPQLRAGGYGPERIVEIELARLDTGSSRDPDRIASEAHRKLAAQALTRKVGRGPALERVTITCTSAAGPTCTIRRSGAELRIEQGGTVCVLPGGNEHGYKEASGQRAELSKEEQAWLERERSSNPFLCGGEDLRRELEGALLEGSRLVFGAPAYRLSLPGEGQREMLFYEDGSPAGYGYRDPVRKGLVEVLVRGERMRESVEGAKQEWSVRLETSPAREAVSHAAPPPHAASELEALVDRLLPSIVKIHGASGLATIEAYASGVIVSDQGHILSLDLVMMQPGMTRVVLADGSVHEAKLLPADDRLGVRMLKIDVDHPLPFLRPAAVKVHNGTFVVSLGNCYRLAEFSEKVSATFGVVMARAKTGLRYRRADVDYAGELLLTDAANNPGHYGGGLFTLQGDWIGLNARIVESTETNTELSAAIPMDELENYVERSIRGEPPAADIEATPVQPVWHGLRLFEEGGRHSPPAYVERVEKDSPAAQAGLKPDDLIVRLDQFTIRSCKEFHEVMGKFRPGNVVEVTYKRGRDVQRVRLTLAEEKK